jgi:hypothetical protein
MLRIKSNKKCSLALIAGISAAAIAVLSVGGYLLHKKIVKRRLQELAKTVSGFYDDDYADDDYDDVFDEDGFYHLANDVRQGDGGNEQ